MAKKTSTKKATSGKKTTKKAGTTKKTATAKSPARKASSKKPAAKQTTAKRSTSKTSTTKKVRVTKKAVESPVEVESAAPKKVLKLVKKSESTTHRNSRSSRRPLIRYRPDASADEAREAPTEEQLKKVKSGLTKKDLATYKQMLLEKRADIVGDVDAMRHESLDDVHKDISYDHMAEAGSDSYEQEFTLSLVESEGALVEQIDEALMRMHKGYYGVCIETGTPIGRARLDAKPWAKYCIAVAREKDRRA